MPKGKSSATSGTRKKNARKHAAKDDDDAPPSGKPQHTKLQRGQKKLSKAQQRALPKIKQYVPPPKPPAPPIPDPLDGQGLARTLPAELVVVLRRLGKKDDVTRRKGLEELREGWISEIGKAGSGDEEEEVERELKETALGSAVPVWMHNLASLLQSPFHRTFALQLHTELLAIPSIRTAILDTLSLSLLPGTQNRDVLGSWLVAALEEGRRAGGAGLRSWEESTIWLSEGATNDGKIDLTPQLSTIVEYLSLAILDPVSLHDDIHPAPVQANPVPPTKGVKGAKSKQTYTPIASTPAEPTEQDNEMADEKWARYRVGGLVGLGWTLQQTKSRGRPLSDEVVALIHNPALWSSLSSLASEEGSPAFGYNHSPVRRAAFTVLTSIVDLYPEELAKEDMIQTLAREMLDTIWLEKEATVWETAGPTVVKILSKHREIWNLSAVEESTTDRKEDDQEAEDNQEDDDSESDDEGEEDEPSADPSKASSETQTSTPPTPVAFNRFLEFISTICPTIPHRTYPLLLVIVSTLPPSLLPLNGPSQQLKVFFSHLWSPVDARLLSTHALPGQPSAFQAFLRDAIDCTTFLLGRANKTKEGQSSAEWLVLDQLGERVWKEGVIELGGRSAGRRAAVGSRSEQEATLFGQGLARALVISPDLRDKLVDLVISTLVQAAEDPEKAAALLPRTLPIVGALKAVNERVDVQQRLNEAVGSVASICANGLLGDQTSSALATVYGETLVAIIASDPTVVSEDTLVSLGEGVQSSSARLLTLVSPSLASTLIQSIGSVNEQAGRQAQESVGLLSRSTEIPQESRFAILQTLLEVNSGFLSSDTIDYVAEQATRSALTDYDETAARLAASCVTNTKLSADALQTILALVSTAVRDAVYGLITTRPETRIPNTAIQIYAPYAKAHLEEVVGSEVYASALVAIHHLVVLLPRLHEDDRSVTSTAKNLWEAAHANVSAGSVRQLVLKDLATLIQDVQCRIEPSILVDVALVVDESSTTSVAKQLLPDTAHIQELVEEYTSRKPNPTLSIIEPLIAGTLEDETIPTSTFDAHGRSKAARLSEAALALIKSARSLASTNPTLLQTILSARALAQDALAVPGASRGFLDRSASVTHLEGAIREAEGALSFALGAFDEVTIAWHKQTVELLKAGQAEKGDLLQQLLVILASGVKGTADDIAARTLRDVLSRHLRQSGAGEPEAEIWLNYGITKAESNPTLSLAILLAVKPLLLDSKALATAQNRLASSLSGVSARQANDKGLPALRILSASAPPPDAPSVFIPQQRALFVLRHIAGWLTSDDADDLDEEVETRIAEVYTALAPIVQDVQGAHWDAIFDLIETGLDAGSLNDLTSLPLVYHCLLLLQQVRDLCDSNKALRASWTSKKTHLSLVLKLFLQCRDADAVPMQLVQDLLLDLLRDAGEDVVGDSGQTELCELLGKSTSTTVQTTAYRLLSQVVKRKTLALVLEVEASVSEEPENVRTIELPAGLVQIVQLGASIDWHEEPEVAMVLGQMLAWMSILDHFDDASRTLRWAYLDQLNTTNLLVESLLPMLFAIMGVSEVGAWNFPAGQFAVDEFYPDLLQPEELPDLAPLASHLFYRALVTIPSAVRTYYEGLKDRQLSMSMLNFTARHYSPVIIQHEFAALRQPAAMATLTEEGLNVRIAQGGGATVAAGGGASEAIASYVVDEQPMEIGIRLPAEFPLRGVDVRDLRRVGVPENKWRGWMMSVQHTITSRNGLILEALTVFKKNVSLHFEGVVECAICYSIISLTDRTLPTKPCRTCKNRFHASCLYKWFNSSHSSSCPLCRALF